MSVYGGLAIGISALRIPLTGRKAQCRMSGGLLTRQLNRLLLFASIH